MSLIGSTKSKTTYYSTAEYYKPIDVENRNVFNNALAIKIRFGEVEPAEKEFYFTAGRLLSSQSYVIETNNFHNYSVKDKFRIVNRITGEKKNWLIRKVTRYETKVNPTSLSLMRFNPSTRFILELE